VPKKRMELSLQRSADELNPISMQIYREKNWCL